MTRTIVTGATGYLGRRIAETLQAQGEDVVAVGRNAAIGKELTERGMTFVNLDLSNIDRAIHLFKGDYIVHSAGHSEPWGAYKTFYQGNVIATNTVIGAAFANRVKRLVHISTPSMYVDTRHRFNITETDPIGKVGISNYTKTKYLAEQAIVNAANNGLRTVTVRPRGIVGPHEGKILPGIAARAHAVPFIDDGRALIELTHIDNVVDAVLRARTRGPVGATYNITNGEPYPFAVLASTLFAHLGTEMREQHVSFHTAYAAGALAELASTLRRNPTSPFSRYQACLIGRSQTYNIQKARDDLGYSPKKSVFDAIAEWAEHV